MMELPAVYKSLLPHERRMVREAYIAKQEGKCAYCGGRLSDAPPPRISSAAINWRLFPPNFIKYPVHLHHSHETGLTIGAVHSRCNAFIWQYLGE